MMPLLPRSSSTPLNLAYNGSLTLPIPSIPKSTPNSFTTAIRINISTPDQTPTDIRHPTSSYNRILFELEQECISTSGLHDYAYVGYLNVLT